MARNAETWILSVALLTACGGGVEHPGATPGTNPAQGTTPGTPPSPPAPPQPGPDPQPPPQPPPPGPPMPNFSLVGAMAGDGVGPVINTADQSAHPAPILCFGGYSRGDGTHPGGDGCVRGFESGSGSRRTSRYTVDHDWTVGAREANSYAFATGKTSNKSQAYTTSNYAAVSLALHAEADASASGGSGCRAGAFDDVPKTAHASTASFSISFWVNNQPAIMTIKMQTPTATGSGQKSGKGTTSLGGAVALWSVICDGQVWNHSGGDSPPPITLPANSMCTVSGSVTAYAWAESDSNPFSDDAKASGSASVYGSVFIDLK
jgi:hypothetical protein